MNVLRTALATAALLTATATASATVITFDNLPGNNGDPFTSYVESGFTVTKDSGSGCVGKSFGNPLPSVFGGPVCDNGSLGVFSVTGSGLFSFDSIDLAANNGALNYLIEGLVGTTLMFSNANSLAGPTAVFSTINSSSNAAIDTLRLTFRTAGTSFNMDNIVLSGGNQVPEPNAALLALLALGVGAATSRRRA